MNNNEFKNAFDNIEPDFYMESRMLANIKESKKRKSVWKPVLSGMFAFAVVIGCFGAFQYNNSYADRPFSVMVVDASEDVPVTEELSENEMLIPNLKLAYTDYESVLTDDDFGFFVVGDGVVSVNYESKIGSFYFADFKRAMYDQERREYYTAVIPVSDDDAQEMEQYINSQQFNPELAGIKKYAETYDLSLYFDGKDVDFRDYWVYFDKCSNMIGYENEDGYAFFLIDAEKGKDYYYATDDKVMNNLTVDNYDLSEETLERFTDEDILELCGVHYSPDAAINEMLENPDLKLSELPGDEITITVKFKDGKRARKTIAVTFNDEGYAQFAFK